MAVIARAEKIGGQSRAKHIDLRHHFIQDKVEAKEIQLIQVASSDNIADGFMKGLPSSPYRKFRDQLILRHVQLGGNVEAQGEKLESSNHDIACCSYLCHSG